MAKQPRDEPRRVESPARMTVADERPVVVEPAMKVAYQPPSATMAELIERVSEAADHENIPEHAIPLETLEAIAAAFPEPSPHNPMATVPRDGTMVNLVTSDGSETRVVWRATRRYNSRAQQWEKTGFWSSPMNRVPVEVDAVGWNLGQGFADCPGAVVA